MKRNKKNVVKKNVVVRVNKGITIYYAIFLFVLVIAAIVTREAYGKKELVIIWILLMLMCLGLVSLYSEQEIIDLEQIQKGNIAILDAKKTVHCFKLEQVEYKVFEKEGHILLKDENDIVLLNKRKKMLQVLKEAGALKKEL